MNCRNCNPHHYPKGFLAPHALNPACTILNNFQKKRKCSKKKKLSQKLKTLKVIMSRHIGYEKSPCRIQAGQDSGDCLWFGCQAFWGAGHTLWPNKPPLYASVHFCSRLRISSRSLNKVCSFSQASSFVCNSTQLGHVSLAPKTGPQVKVYNGANYRACGGAERWSRNGGDTR